MIHDGLKKPAKKKNSGTLPNVDRHHLFYRTCSYFENGTLAIGVEQCENTAQKSTSHLILPWDFLESSAREGFLFRVRGL